MPYSAGHSFRTFQSKEMGFENAPLAKVPDLFAENQRLLMQVMHNTTLAADLNEELRLKAEEAEARARLFELKYQKAEKESSAAMAGVAEMQGKFKEFCLCFEQTIIPWLDEGRALLTEHEVDDIPSFKARIEEKLKREAAARTALAEELEAEKARHEAESQLLVSHLDSKDSDLNAARSELQELKSQLAAQLEETAKVKAEAEKAKTELSAANDLLQVRVYTRAQYEEGFDNGFNVARRLAFHTCPEINWDQVEEWAAVPNHPNSRVAHPAEDAFLARLEAEADEDEAETCEAPAPAPADAEA
ncbi:uncharacterized protein LOC110735530 [Chenopodium quinoa]|uniref:uncharacterized protein LOC110735530 n=1 Tax=Chenopodium quinoa TaxID=63459 RepID=UPI000B770C5E|nr:uncharacterized protein LOC110735530 [Chenopodium quinoa]